MKNNVVKILATLGLIVAIALVLKGVFGVGKIGFNKITNSDNSKKIGINKTVSNSSKKITNSDNSKKIGINKTVSNSPKKITFENCWDIDDYESYEHSMKKSSIDSQTFEIDTSTKRVVKTTIWSDEFVQTSKDMQKEGIPIDANKIDQNTMTIESYTDNFVTTKPFKIIDSYSRVLGTDKFVFNLRDGTYENSYKNEKYGDVSTYKSKCEKY